MLSGSLGSWQIKSFFIYYLDFYYIWKKKSAYSEKRSEENHHQHKGEELEPNIKRVQKT